jgi:hypothetical protein
MGKLFYSMNPLIFLVPGAIGAGHYRSSVQRDGASPLGNRRSFDNHRHPPHSVHLEPHQAG